MQKGAAMVESCYNVEGSNIVPLYRAGESDDAPSVRLTAFITNG